MRYFVSGGTSSLRRWIRTYSDCFGRLLVPGAGNAMDFVLPANIPWAVDNGAFSGFKPNAFRRLVDAVSGNVGLQWVAVPDVVADSVATNRRFYEWQPELAGRVPLAFVLQDGATSYTVPWDDIAGVFVGGSTGFKLSFEAAELVREAKDRGLLAHMGRVNSRRRLRYAAAIGCDSVDGTSASRFGDVCLPKYAKWIRAIRHERRLF